MTVFPIASLASVLILSAICHYRKSENDSAFSFSFGVVVATIAFSVCAVYGGVWNTIRYQVDYVASALFIIPVLTSLFSGRFASVVDRELAKVEFKLLGALESAEEVVGLVKPRDQEHGRRILDLRKGLARAVANLESRRGPLRAWIVSRKEPYYKNERLGGLDIGDLVPPEELKADLERWFEAIRNLETRAVVVSRLDERPLPGAIS